MSGPSAHALPSAAVPSRGLPSHDVSLPCSGAWDREAGAAARGLGRALCVVAHPTTSSSARPRPWALDRPGQAGRLLHADQWRGRHRRDAPDACRSVREAEQVESARIVGVPTVEVPAPARRDPRVRRAAASEIAQVVRRHRPEIVVTGNFRETWGGASLNQADHIATGRAVVDAVRDAGNRWVFPSSSTGSNRGEACAPSGPSAHRPRRTRSTRPTRSTPAWPPSRRAGPTSTASGGSTSTPARFLGASDGRAASVSASPSRPPSRCSRWAGASSRSTAERALQRTLGSTVCSACPWSELCRPAEIEVRIDRASARPFGRRFPPARSRGEQRLSCAVRRRCGLMPRRSSRAAGAGRARNDGRQTPYRNHPVFVAQHATATCCRSCLETWHGIAKGHRLDRDERAYVVG